MASDRKPLSRRDVLSLAGGAAGVLVSGRAVAKTDDSGSRHGFDPHPPGPVMREQTLPAASNAARTVLGGLEHGVRTGEWTVAAIYDFHFGAIPVVLQGEDGARFQVDVLRRDPSVRAVAETRQLSFFLANRGNGATPSDERHGLGALALAAWIGDREGSCNGLLTHSERSARHRGAGFRVPV